MAGYRIAFGGGETVEYGEGDGIDIPAGAGHEHKAAPLTESVLLFLVD